MATPHATTSHWIRPAGLVVLFASALGLIGYSCVSISYPVGDTCENEFGITELSLTHSVERGPDGSLKSRDHDETAEAAWQEPQGEPELPTAVQEERPAAHEDSHLSQREPVNPEVPPPGASNPRITKPAPAKPAPKKPAKGKEPCPT